MKEAGFGERLARFYLAHSRLIGGLYGVVPVVLWFAAALCFIPFRGVYGVRFVLALLLAGAAGASFHAYGVRLWLIKHSSKFGPGTVLDGAMIGVLVGLGTALLPPLTSLIASHHPEAAKEIIVFSWLAAVVVGGIWGGIVAFIGGRHIDRSNCL